MKGMKLRVPPAPLYLMLAKSVGANATPIAFAEVYLALQQGTVDGQENPLPTIMAKKFYEVQSHIMLTGHITESLLTIVGSHVWAKLTDDEKKIFEEVLAQAAGKATDAIRASEQKLVDEQDSKSYLGPEGDMGFVHALMPYVFGGEDRFWLGPEGGQFALYFKQGDPFDLDHWQVPEPFDWGAWEIAGQNGSAVQFHKPMTLANYSGTPFDVDVERSVRLLPAAVAASMLGTAAAESIRMVAFESSNTEIS
jgi:hypothetical protein